MTDNTPALLERLRYKARCESTISQSLVSNGYQAEDQSDCWKAADTIEALTRELAEVKRERDAMAEALRIIQTNAMNKGFSDKDFRYTTERRARAAIEAMRAHAITQEEGGRDDAALWDDGYETGKAVAKRFYEGSKQ